jgi:hypothetical protein
MSILDVNTIRSNTWQNSSGVSYRNIINVYNFSASNTITINTEVWTDIASITLTPASAISRFVLMADIPVSKQSSGAEGLGLLFRRSGTYLHHSPHDGASTTVVDGATYRPFDFYKDETRFYIRFQRNFVDAPATTSAITYSVMMRPYAGAALTVSQLANGNSPDRAFIIYEVAA